MPYKLLKIWFFIAKAGLAAEQSPEIDGQGCIITRVTARKIPTLPGGPPYPTGYSCMNRSTLKGINTPMGTSTLKGINALQARSH
jgi:hypothetical protein